MTPEIARRLTEINNTFYDDHARAFSHSRSPSGTELEWIIPWIPTGARVLDLGCGNGRSAVLLASRGFRGTYVGIDGSTSLVRTARESAAYLDVGSVTFLASDLLQDDIQDTLRREDLPTSFDVALLLAVLHHIPGSRARETAMNRAARFLEPDGRLLISTWQFLDHERMRKKIVPWSLAGIEERDVDPHDALLGWQGGAGYRYCHWIGEEELGELARAGGLDVACMTRAGGKEGTLSLCAVLERQPHDCGLRSAD